MNELSVYEFYWDAGGYGGGLLLIAASCSEYAIDEAKTLNKYWKYGGIVDNLIYRSLYNKAYVITENYYQE